MSNRKALLGKKLGMSQVWDEIIFCAKIQKSGH